MNHLRITMAFNPTNRPRHLVLVLGDQLDARSSAFDEFDPAADAVWMAEVSAEASHVWSHKARIAIFLSAMRHFRDDLRHQGITVHYRLLDDSRNRGTFALELADAVKRLKPRGLILVEPGEWRVKEEIEGAAKGVGVPLEIRADRHFLCSRESFAEFASERKQLRMEFFYRRMRRETGILMDDNQPAGGQWNYDAENRAHFGKKGPGKIPKPKTFSPDDLTQEVIQLVEKRFFDHPGSLRHFDWPVTPEQASEAVSDFVANRLADFGKYQDAMWSQEPYLYHSRLSSAMNLKLVDPRQVMAEAEKAHKRHVAPINSVEGFIRQVLGWREYVRGIYWHFMPEYIDLNELMASLPLPRLYWDGHTDMNCLREAVGQTLDYGFAHHIQRLMVTGLFALLLGVRPKEVHEWYLAVYVDAVEWVELPNTLGMSQFADGGIMASKPYVATGKYIQRMSNYCAPCRYNPADAIQEDACPFTTLYWDFLMRHETLLRRNPRMQLQMRNLSRLPKERQRAIRRQAGRVRKKIT